jgi:flagellar FliL protein
MADTGPAVAEAPRKASKLPVIIGLVLMLVLGGGGFYAVWSGLILGPGPAHGSDGQQFAVTALPDIAFVPMDPLVISLHSNAGARNLLFRAQLEVVAAYKADVELLLPRVVDVLNGYLRAVDLQELQDPGALLRLRAQMLRRVQIVTGAGRVRDLLVAEFVMN